jgi:hypothetical protein
MPIRFRQKANWNGAGEAAARKFLKNQASPVFQKPWRLASKGKSLLFNARINKEPQ